MAILGLIFYVILKYKLVHLRQKILKKQFSQKVSLHTNQFCVSLNLILGVNLYSRILMFPLNFMKPVEVTQETESGFMVVCV